MWGLESVYNCLVFRKYLIMAAVSRGLFSHDLVTQIHCNVRMDYYDLRPTDWWLKTVVLQGGTLSLDQDRTVCVEKKRLVVGIYLIIIAVRCVGRVSGPTQTQIVHFIRSGSKDKMRISFPKLTSEGWKDNVVRSPESRIPSFEEQCDCLISLLNSKH